MTQSRRSQISLKDTCYYHLISRCVRRSFLCGIDNYTKKSFEHRRQWMVNRIRFLSSIFAIDVASYAVMSNHYHLVVHVNEDESQSWSIEEVCERYENLYHLPPPVKQLLISRENTETKNTTAICQLALELVEKYRSRLSDISWFMRNLNEYVARKANIEDECKGHFWESRFKSQALLDNKALLACMAYVDLNPIRAKIASSPSNSQFTSVFERIHDKSSENDNKNNLPFKVKPLLGFVGAENKNSIKGIAFSFRDYLQLVDETGRVMISKEKGRIDGIAPSLLHQLGIEGEDWLYLAKNFGRVYHQAVGSLELLVQFSENTNKKWISGQRQQCKIFT